MELSSGGLQAAGWVLESQPGVAGGRWGSLLPDGGTKQAHVQREARNATKSAIY